jgi:two-component system response regulator GlrR
MLTTKVLLIDDDESLLKLLSIRLSATGFELQTALSAEDALSRLPVFKPHAIVTDLQMGGMDGLALFDVVHRQYPSLPVIILTAHGTIKEAVNATRKGVFGFLTKPFDSKELVQQIEDAVRFSGITEIEEPNEQWSKEIITRSALMNELLNQAKRVAQLQMSVFIQGASGTGKELLARAIHAASPRAKKSFIAVNCSAIPENLLESELFGHRKGAFTGATSHHEGLFRAADGGTLFLDEIGDMPKSFQVKLLRVLQEQKVRAVGSTEDIPVDVRIVSATHVDLDEAMEAGDFREDLYYRLNVIALSLPTLVERREDIPLLANHFLSEFSVDFGAEVKGFSPEATEALVNYNWPGNIRQLHNVVGQTVALSTTPLVPLAVVQKALKNDSVSMLSFKEAREGFEREYLIKILQMTSGNVTQAAKYAKRNRTEFYRLLNRHQLDPSLFKNVKAK